MDIVSACQCAAAGIHVRSANFGKPARQTPVEARYGATADSTFVHLAAMRRIKINV
jgi:hypothetical protein